MAKRNSVSIRAPLIPEAGQRIGSVCGPGEYPKDNAGTVLCQITDEWGTHALVLMDSGKTERCDGLNSGPGIGWHLIEPKSQQN